MHILEQQEIIKDEIYESHREMNVKILDFYAS